MLFHYCISQTRIGRFYHDQLRGAYERSHISANQQPKNTHVGALSERTSATIHQNSNVWTLQGMDEQMYGSSISRSVHTLEFR